MTTRYSSGLSRLGAGVALGGVALGSLLYAKLRDGRSPDDAPGYTGRHDADGQNVVGRTVTIRKGRAELFAFWRDFSNLASFMENLDHVDVADGASGVSTWHIKAPAGRTVSIKTRILEEEADRKIAWRSVEGSDIDTEGEVLFEDAPGERGTRVTLVIGYKPPAGEIGKAIAKLFLREPEIQARHDLKRFKMLMETGEIATSARIATETRAARQENRS